MGIEYLLIKPNLKELFYLGKGAWSNVFDVDSGNNFKFIPELKQKIIKEDSEYWGYKKKKGKILAGYIEFWCGNDDIQAYSDCYFGDNFKIIGLEDDEYADMFADMFGYKETGTRHKTKEEILEILHGKEYLEFKFRKVCAKIAKYEGKKRQIISKMHK